MEKSQKSSNYSARQELRNEPLLARTTVFSVVNTPRGRVHRIDAIARTTRCPFLKISLVKK
jgi:hypothetical protein